MAVKKIITRLLLLVCLLALPVVASPEREEGAVSSQATDDFTLQLRWSDQAQFMGYYAAAALGYYEQENLNVALLPGGIGIEPMGAVREGRADAVVEWLSTVLISQAAGTQLVNVAQIFQRSGITIICHRDRGIVHREQLRNRTFSVWLNGSEVPLVKWLDSLRTELDEPLASARMIEQVGALEDWNSGVSDCVSALIYNEYWTLLESGLPLSSTTIFKFEDLGFNLLEDGIYVDAQRLTDPEFVDRLGRFLRASIRGWKYALERPREAVDLVIQVNPSLDRLHQIRMAEEIVGLVATDQHPLGLLQIEDYDRTTALLEGSLGAKNGVEQNVAHHAWTHDLWYQITSDEQSAFSIEVRYRLEEILSTRWFYILDLIGTLAFGIAGFVRAEQRHYDIWGALVLTSLPAIGGGTVRDLLVGGDRYPPFIFTDSTYIYIVLAVVFVGALTNFYRRSPRAILEQFPRIFLVIDAIGLAAFAIIGAKVAIVAQLDWYWIPFLAALTCAGGGVLLDIFTAQEPRTFKGIMYEEVAILGGLFLAAMLYFGRYVDDIERHIVVSIIMTFFLVFFTRIAIVRFGWRALQLR